MYLCQPECISQAYCTFNRVWLRGTSVFLKNILKVNSIMGQRSTSHWKGRWLNVWFMIPKRDMLEICFWIRDFSLLHHQLDETLYASRKYLDKVFLSFMSFLFIILNCAWQGKDRFIICFLRLNVEVDSVIVAF